MYGSDLSELRVSLSVLHQFRAFRRKLWYITVYWINLTHTFVTLFPITSFGLTVGSSRGLVHSRHELGTPICSSMTSGLVTKYCTASTNFVKPASRHTCTNFLLSECFRISQLVPASGLSESSSHNAIQVVVLIPDRSVLTFVVGLTSSLLREYWCYSTTMMNFNNNSAVFGSALVWIEDFPSSLLCRAPRDTGIEHLKNWMSTFSEISTPILVPRTTHHAPPPRYTPRTHSPRTTSSYHVPRTTHDAPPAHRHHAPPARTASTHHHHARPPPTHHHPRTTFQAPPRTTATTRQHAPPTTHLHLPRTTTTTQHQRAPRTTHHAPRTTHHAPRTTHHAPRTTHHAPRNTTRRHFLKAAHFSAWRPCVLAPAGQSLRLLHTMEAAAQAVPAADASDVFVWCCGTDGWQSRWPWPSARQGVGGDVAHQAASNGGAARTPRGACAAEEWPQPCGTHAWVTTWVFASAHGNRSAQLAGVYGWDVASQRGDQACVGDNVSLNIKRLGKHLSSFWWCPGVPDARSQRGCFS